MLGTKRRPRGVVGSGFVWCDTGNGTPSDVRDVFGARPFPAHIATVGYDYDFHRGVDAAAAAGAPVYAISEGPVFRLHRTHYGWETDAQLGYWTESDPGGAAQFTRVSSSLHIVGERVGAQTFAQAARWKALRERVQVVGGDWELQLELAASIALAGGNLGLAVLDEANTQYAAIEYDGAVATALGVGSGGAFAASGTTLATAGRLWLRVRYIGTTLSWGVSDDGDTWVDVATQATPAWTDSRPVFTPLVYWRSTDTDAADQVIDVDYVGWYDGQTVGRFGNWLEIGHSGALKVAQMHFQDLDIEVGDYVKAGQQIGLAGMTGFDDRSGHINQPHVHVEFCPNNNRDYANTDPVNPLAAGFLPRANTGTNVTVARTTENDPDGVTSWRVRIQVARGDQDFDFNAITLAGDVATRTVNWNTRAGLNADNDIPKQAGVYIVPSDFDEDSPAYEVSFYFNKSVVGTTFVSLQILDTAGNILYAE